MIALAVLIGLCAGNFFYQALTGQDWTVAFDRTYFQAVALGVAYFVTKATP